MSRWVAAGERGRSAAALAMLLASAAALVGCGASARSGPCACAPEPAPCAEQAPVERAPAPSVPSRRVAAAPRTEASTAGASAADPSPSDFEGVRPLAVSRGAATYYGDSLAGHRTASGEPYRPSAYTAAHRTLPFGSVVRVTRLDTGTKTYVRITDRGPFGGKGRIIDLSHAAAEQIGMLRAGVIDVKVEVLRRASPRGR